MVGICAAGDKGYLDVTPRALEDFCDGWIYGGEFSGPIWDGKEWSTFPRTADSQGVFEKIKGDEIRFSWTLDVVIPIAKNGWHKL